jgi:glycerophosphoryl diester phosphodiesterase
MSETVNPWPYPRWIAHRGAGKLAPENTLAAFRVGASHGYRAFECDVKLSADGELILLHDTTLERTTDAGAEPAGQWPWARLSHCDAGSWHSRTYAGEPIPRLESIVRFVHSNGYRLNLEIKPTPGQEAETGLAVAMAIRRLWNSVDAPWPLLSSFQPEALLAAMRAAPEIPRGLLLDERWRGWDRAAGRLEVVAVIANFQILTARWTRELHAQGRRVLCYTVNEPQDAQRLLDWGVDGLITDAVDRFGPACD